MPQKLKYVEEAICIVCGEKYPRRTMKKKSRGRGMSFKIRGMNTKTCSKECTKINNIYKLKNDTSKS